MSFVTTSDQLPQWAQHCPMDWQRDWLKWHVSHHAQRPTKEQAAELPYISNEDIASWTGTLLRENPQPSESDGRLFERNDVLFNKLRPYLAKVYHANFDGISSGELLCLHPGADVVPRFLFYVLVSKGFVDAVDSASFGSKMPRADWEIVGHQPLPLPPLEIQHRITRFLDAKTARIDALIAKKRVLLEQLAEKRQALITQAVTQGLDPTTPMKDSGIDWLGQIPAHWDVKRLRFVVRLASGATPSTGTAEYWDGDIPWISPKDVKRDLLNDSQDRVTSLAVCECGLKLFSEPDVVLVVRGMILARYVPVAVATGTYTINQDIKVLESKGSVKPGYLQMYLASINSYLMTLVAEAGHGTKALRTDVLLDSPVLLPPIDEQHQIAASMKTIKRSLDQGMTKMAESISALVEYRSALITAAVTGQLDIPAALPEDQAEAPLGTLTTEEA